MRNGTRFHGLPTLGIAAAALALGHLATYAIALPDPHHRELALQGSGHGYLSAFSRVALILALAGAVTIAARAWSAGRRASASLLSLARTMIFLQVTAFVALEMLERMVTGASLADLRSGRLLVIGVLVQATVAVVGSAAAWWLARASDRISDAELAVRDRLWRPAAFIPLAIAADALGGVGAPTTHRGRSPPSS